MRPIETAHRFFLRGTLFLLPLFFLPVTADAYDLNKLSLLAAGLLLSVIFWSLAIRGEFKIRTTPLDLPVLAFAAVTLVSALLVTPNKIDAFVFPGTASLVLAGTLLYFLVVQVASGKRATHRSPLPWFLAGSALAALVSIWAGIGLFKAFPGAPAWLAQETFSTTGGLLPSLTLFVALLPVAISGFVNSRSPVEIRTFYAVSSVLLIVGVGIVAFHAMPGKAASPKLLPLSSGWSIGLETFKRNPVLGVGPGNFIEAFARFRPVEFNNTAVWNLRFSTSSNWFLHIFTTMGLLGIASFAWIILKAWQYGRWHLKDQPLTSLHLSLLAALVLFFLVPGNFLLLVAFYLLLGAVAAPWGNDVDVVLGTSDRRQKNLLPVFLSLFTVVLLLFTLFLGGKVYLADVSYAKALAAASRNEGTPTYNALIEAINRNPRRDVYRITYSQVNLALANGIAGNPPAGGEISDQDRQTISQLVQQAIREAKAAVALNQQRSGSWENLARIYQALIPFAQGADQWTVSSYGQAIALDPVNPLLRIGFGGVYYSLGQYETAARVFELAVAAKPDLANAHYNLAAALREKGDTQRAAQEMEIVLQLVKRDSQDYQIAQTELEALRGKLAKEREATASGETLEVSETPTEPILEPPLELGEEAAPPSTRSASPRPSPSPAP